jgi:hypothetical protein
MQCSIALQILSLGPIVHSAACFARGNDDRGERFQDRITVAWHVVQLLIHDALHEEPIGIICPFAVRLTGSTFDHKSDFLPHCIAWLSPGLI